MLLNCSQTVTKALHKTNLVEKILHENGQWRVDDVKLIKTFRLRRCTRIDPQRGNQSCQKVHKMEQYQETPLKLHRDGKYWKTIERNHREEPSRASLWQFVLESRYIVPDIVSRTPNGNCSTIMVCHRLIVIKHQWWARVNLVAEDAIVPPIKESACHSFFLKSLRASIALLSGRLEYI